MGRTTIPPAATMPPPRFAGTWVAHVDPGDLTITLISGEIEVDGWDGENQPRPGVTVEVGQGSDLRFGPDAVMTWSNEGLQPVVILTDASVDGDVKAVMDAPLVEERAYEPLRGQVRKRVVVEGMSVGIDPYPARIVVRDRSGQLLGARLPTATELRFVWASLLESNERVRLGPVRSIDRDVNEMLLSWTTGTCGPVATIDIGRALLPHGDPAAIKVTDRSPGRDSAGKEATVVLRFRTPYTGVEDIDARLAYR